MSRLFEGFLEVGGALLVITGVIGLVIGIVKKGPAVVASLQGNVSRRRLAAVAGNKREGEEPIQFAARQLRDALIEHWDEELDRRELQREIRVSWELVGRIPSEFKDEKAKVRLAYWSDAQRATVDQLADFYEDLHPHGLVILGSAASGKSASTVLFMRKLLERWQAGKPVPVHFSVGRWGDVDMKTTFVDWLGEQLLVAHPWLRSADYGENAALALVKGKYVLPVLDGLDEIDQRDIPLDQRDLPKFVTALAAASSLPGVVLTCRTEEYRSIGERGVTLKQAALKVTLLGVRPSDAGEYLMASLAEEQLDKWNPVLRRLGSQRSDLAEVLKTPLMVFLLSKVYMDATREELNELVALNREEIRYKLLSGFVPAVFDGTPKSNGWNGKEATRWLGHLASMMGSKQQIAWWELSWHGRPWTTRAAGLIAAIVAGGAVALALTILFNPVAGAVFGGITAVSLGLLSAFHSGSPKWLRWTVRRVVGERVMELMDAPTPPKDIEAQFSGRGLSTLLGGLVIGAIVLVVGTVVRDLAFGAVAGLSFGLAITLLYGTTATDPKARGPDPVFLFWREIRVGIAFGCAYGLFAAVVGWAITSDLAISLLLGIACGLAGGLLQGPIWVLAGRGAPGLTAFGHLTLASIQLAAQRKMPLRTLSFLETAHERGVLRLGGNSYEFRHEDLQSLLRETVTGPVEDPATAEAGSGPAPGLEGEGSKLAANVEPADGHS